MGDERERSLVLGPAYSERRTSKVRRQFSFASKARDRHLRIVVQLGFVINKHTTSESQFRRTTLGLALMPQSRFESIRRYEPIVNLSKDRFDDRLS